MKIFVTDVDGGIEVGDAFKNKDNFCVVLGSESHGVSEDVKNIADEVINIKRPFAKCEIYFPKLWIFFPMELAGSEIRALLGLGWVPAARGMVNDAEKALRHAKDIDQTVVTPHANKKSTTLLSEVVLF